MIRWLLHRIFTVVRFVQLEWAAWVRSYEELPQETVAPQDDAEVTEERVIEEEIRERINGRSTMLTDQQIRNASIVFVGERRKIKERDAAYEAKRASRR